MLISSQINTPANRRAKEYSKLVDEIVSIYEQDPNLMGRVLGEGVREAPFANNISPNVIRKHLINRYTESAEWKLDRDDLKTVIDDYQRVKQK